MQAVGRSAVAMVGAVCRWEPSQGAGTTWSRSTWGQPLTSLIIALLLLLDSTAHAQGEWTGGITLQAEPCSVPPLLSEGRRLCGGD